VSMVMENGREEKASETRKDTLYSFVFHSWQPDGVVVSAKSRQQ
jgi:hypothetical protein